ncbi:hypothetical protein GCM10010275_63150 [Streptomyces litmocidini]|uniref:hypothetical protein n=1 Tax=Streptomyces litmocidini TaxID=67318 RepID=UPI00167E342F|nr:hypothetical protein [Streptomyces litmocidini]GGV13426.1 hypothetical protein GCM10010275_63150 [Streptomyces litmocidini]
MPLIGVVPGPPRDRRFTFPSGPPSPDESGDELGAGEMTKPAGPGHAIDDAARSAVLRLVRAGEVRSDVYAGPVGFVLRGVNSEARARELAAVLHGHLEPPTATVPART